MNHTDLTLADFDFDLPADRIAQHPVEPRDTSRLLAVEGSELKDRTTRDLPSLLRPGDLLVVNNTRVIPARIRGRRVQGQRIQGGEAKIEATLHLQESDDIWRAFARPARRLQAGDRIEIAEGFHAEVLDKLAGGEIRIRLMADDAPVIEALQQHGAMPLPPYIRRNGPDRRDLDDYQTIYARHDGAVAAPTAGLHFTPDLFKACAAQGLAWTEITLHVGAGTFLPVRTDRLSEHRMHAEIGEIDAHAADEINAARARGGRIIAVGSTVLRLLETVAEEDGTVRPMRSETNLFIQPGYRFRAIDLLVTNFHLPKSTLFIMTAAFSGLERMHHAYTHAIAAGYRFYSYGDCCLLHPAQDESA